MILSILAISLLLPIWIISLYVGHAKLNVNVDNSRIDMRGFLKRRYDVIPNISGNKLYEFYDYENFRETPNAEVKF